MDEGGAFSVTLRHDLYKSTSIQNFTASWCGSLMLIWRFFIGWLACYGKQVTWVVEPFFFTLLDLGYLWMSQHVLLFITMVSREQPKVIKSLVAY